MSERWEWAWFKRSNGHRVTAPSQVPLPLGVFGLTRSNRYVLRKRQVVATEWEDA